MLFALMINRPENDIDDDYTNNGDSDNTISASATQTLDMLAMYLPPEKLIPHLVRNNLLIINNNLNFISKLINKVKNFNI